MRRLVHPLVAALAMAAVWGDPAHRVVGRAEGEFRDHVWVSWLVQRRVLDDHAWPLSFPLADFPTGLSLYPLDPVNQLVLLGLSPLGLFASHAILAFTLLTLAGHAGARLAAACGARPWPATVAGALVQVGPPVLGVFADTQTEGMGSGWAVWTLATLVDPAPWTRRRAVALGLLGGTTVLSAPYQAHALALVGVPIALWAFRRHVRLGLLALLLAAPAGALAVAGLWHAESHADGQIAHRTRAGDWPPRTVLRIGEVPPQIAQVSTLSPVALHPWPREPRFLPPTTGPRVDPGWIFPALVLLAALHRPARPLAAVAALYASLAYGSALDHDWTRWGATRVPLPFDLWYRWFPLGHLAWKPAQYAVLAWAAGSAALGVAPRVWLSAFAALELQLRGPTPLPLPAMAVYPLPFAERLAAEPGGAVVEFPSRARGRLGPETLPGDELLHQLTHGHPIGETFGRGFNKPRQGVVDSLAAVLGWTPGGPSPAGALEYARREGYGWLVVHGDALTAEELLRVRAVVPGTPEELADHTLLYRLDG